jgi:HSP20 family molecular chaperone IbpA
MNTNVENQTNDTNVERTRPLRVLVPRCDIFEREDAVHLLCEMPGADESTIDVTLERSILTISGRFDASAPEGYRAVWREFEGGEYRRTFELSNEANANGIEASIQNGVLSVKVPKTKPAQRRIPVMSR